MSDSPDESTTPSATNGFDRTRELITHLQNPPTKKRYLRRIGLDKTVFFTAGFLAVAFVVWGFISPESLGVVAGAALTGVMDTFGWLFVIAAT
ncbi:BCCT family transporter, partial [Burkholderia multivorans]